MNKTIKQLADELGVSKTAIRNYMDDAFRENYTEKDNKGVITINADGCKVIAESIGKFAESDTKHFAESSGNSETITIPKSVLDTLQEQLKQKDLQIEAKDRQIEALTESVKAQAQSINADRHNELAGTVGKTLIQSPKESFWEKIGFKKKDKEPYEV